MTGPDTAARTRLGDTGAEPVPPQPSFLPQASDTGGVRALKIAIIGMGMLIVIGLFAIAAKMISIAGGDGSAATAPPATVISLPTTDASPKPATQSVPTSALPQGATITDTAFDGRRLAITYALDNDQFVVIIDTKSSIIDRRLQLTPGQAASGQLRDPPP